MIIISIILLQVFIFGGLVFFLRHLLTRNVTDATAHLQGMAKDYTEKQEEIKKKLQEAEAQYKDALKKAEKEITELKEKNKKEIEAERDKIIEQAHKQSEELMSRAHVTCETMQSELEKNINARAQERAAELICRVLPPETCKDIHAVWVESLITNAISGLDRLRVPDDINKAKVTTAFTLTKSEKNELKNKLKERLEREIEISEDVQPNLVAGIVISLGNLVFDGSFSSKIQEVACESNREG